MNAKRANEHSAGYMELAGAKKDGECEIVEVKGGVSRKLGCCDLFWPENEQTKVFSCGTCEFIEVKPLSAKEARAMSPKEILESERPAEEMTRWAD
jgi:hypothetical protein